MPTVKVNLSTTEYVQVNTAFNPILLQAHRDSVRIALSELKPVKGNDVFHQLGGDDQPLNLHSIDTNVWALAMTDRSSLIVSETEPYPIALHDGDGNPISSLKGAIDVHDADLHDVPVNELFHRHTGVKTTLAVASLRHATSIQVVDGSAFANGDAFQIEETVLGVTTIEVTFPTIITGGGTNTFVLDRPLDNAFGTTATVEHVETNMALAVGTLTNPVIYQLLPDSTQTWHIVRFLLAMVHTTAGDDSKFGNITDGLTNGCVLRGYNGTADTYRMFTNWKSNFDIKMDMFNLPNTDKAGAGNFGTNGRGSIRDGTGAVPKLDGSDGSVLEFLVQDDLTQLIKFNLKGQGHIEGL